VTEGGSALSIHILYRVNRRDLFYRRRTAHERKANWQTLLNELEWRGILLCAEPHDNAADVVWSARRIA